MIMIAGTPDGWRGSGSPWRKKARDEWREVRMSDERARFLSAWREESEERIEQDFLAGEIAA
jgi:hypothetical protein